MSTDRKRARAAALLKKFRTVAGERLERLENAYVAVEADPSDADAGNVLIREIHTLKGEAKLMGLEAVNRVAHRTEDVIFRMRDDGWRASDDLGQTILAGFDLVGALMGDEESAPAEGAVDDFAERVDRVLSSDAPEATQTGVEGLVTVPPPPTIRATVEPAAAEPSSRLAPTLVTPPAEPGPEPETPRRQARQMDASSTIRVDIDKLDALADKISDIVRASQRVETTLSRLRTIGRSWRQAHRQLERERSLGANDQASLERAVTRLEALNGEMLDELLQDQEGAFVREHGLRELEDVIKRLRLVPLSSLFERFPRSVRDLARELGKEVRFEVIGGEHAVDNRVLDHLADPLVHLIRNAVDHGIETPSARHASGKLEAGVVRLSARQSGSSVEIVVADDGRGVDPERVRVAAVERGFLDTTAAASLTDEQAVRLVLEPGFTTRSQATDVSGRGVGLDVVREKIEALGGSVWLDGAPGAGTAVTLRVPVSVALMPALVVRVGDVPLAFPSHAVAAVVDTAREELRDVGSGSALWLGDRHVVLEHLPTLLGTTSESEEPESLRVLVIEDQGRELGLWGAEVLTERQLTLKPLDPFMRDLHLFVGTSILDTGEPALVVSVAELVRRGRQGTGRDLVVPSRRRSDESKVVLLVEDSEVIRDMLERIVRGEGYLVREAANGRDGLASVEEQKPDLIVTDLEMPVMDGFELIRQVRAREELSRIPIVVLSSRGSIEDRRRAGDLGADAYLVKTDFREELLRETIERFFATEGVRRR